MTFKSHKDFVIVIYLSLDVPLHEYQFKLKQFVSALVAFDIGLLILNFFLFIVIIYRREIIPTGPVRFLFLII